VDEVNKCRLGQITIVKAYLFVKVAFSRNKFLKFFTLKEVAHPPSSLSSETVTLTQF